MPGGKLCIQVFGAGPSLRVCDGIYDVLEAGMIDRYSDEAFYQPVYCRTLDEIVSPVRGTPFRVDHAETYEVEDDFNDARAAGCDLATYARRYTGFYLAFTEPVVRRHCGPRPDHEALSEAIYARSAEGVAAAPDLYPHNYIAHAF